MSACAAGIANARDTPSNVITANTQPTSRTPNTENASKLTALVMLRK
jgi:hypothetical protein